MKYKGRRKSLLFNWVRRMKILSWDQSSNLSGYCLFDKNIVESGVIDKHKIKDSSLRIAEMSKAICEKIDEFKVDVVVLEGIQNQGSIATVILLARLQGMILGYCYAHGIRTEILGPSQWRSKLKFKQGAGVKRDDLKQQAMDYVLKEYGLEVDVDQSEAVCIAVAEDKIYNTK